MRALGVGMTAFVLVAASLAASVPPRDSLPAGDGGIACVDVAGRTGLAFRGEYGPVPADGDFSVMSQRNMGNGAAAGDYNSDGWLDIYLLGQAGHQSKLFRNVPGPNGSRRFEDVTAAAGLAAQTGLSRMAQFVDLTGNGRLDLVVFNDYVLGSDMVPSKLYRNSGDGTFTDVTAGSGFNPSGYIVGGASFADYDGSGLPSVYVSYWLQGQNGGSARDPNLGAIRATFPGNNVLYRNLGGYHFADVTQSSGLVLYQLARDTFATVFADFTGDGRPDLYQAVDHRADLFFENAGDGTFVNRTADVGLGERFGNSMGVATADLLGDGSLDVFITNITDATLALGTNQGNTLMVSRRDGGGLSFSDEAGARGVFDAGWGWGTAFVDANLDGWQDLYAVQGFNEFLEQAYSQLAAQRARMFLNDGTNHFSLASGTGCDVPGDQRSLVVLDYNRDGLPDMLVTQVNGPVLLLENRSRGHGHWITVIPEGPGASTVNARIAVTAGGRTTDTVLLAGGSYLAGPPREAYVGLGAATTIDTVEVTWSNGRHVVLRGVAVERVLRVPMPGPD